MKKKQIFLLFILVCFLTQLIIGNGKNSQSQNDTYDSFKMFFELEKVVPLSEEKNLIGSIRDFSVDTENNFWILDSRQCKLYKYTPDGKFISYIGGVGQGPGEFGKPFSFFIGKKYIYVVDPVSRKANVFGLQGVFKYFFHIEDGRIVKEGKNGEVIITGLVIKSSNKGDCIHIYDQKGNLKKSFFPINKNASRHDLICDGIYFDIDQKGDLYCIQEMEYKTHHFDISGKLIHKFSHNNPHYIPPPGKIFEKKHLRSLLVKWIKSWTHIVGIHRLDNLLLITLQYTKSAHKYMLDIYNKDGELVDGGLGTNFRLLHVDRKGKLYFLDEKKSHDLEDFSYRILVYRMKNK